MGLPTPPFAAAYQSNVLPTSAVAVSGWAAVPVHKLTGLVTLGCFGTGFTVMVKLAWVVQPLLLAVIVMVAVMGVLPVFVVVKLVILPVPLDANPMAGLLFVQVMVVPASLLVKFNAPLAEPAQYDVSACAVRSGKGFTVSTLVNAVGPQVLLSSTVKVTLYGPDELYTTCPGFCAVELAGVPPVNVHE